MFNKEESIGQLHQNVQKLFTENFPMEYNDHIIKVSNITFEQPKDDYAEQKDAFLNESSLETRVRGNVVIEKDGEEVVKSNNVVLTTIPHVTERGTYILGGNEKVFINQMSLRPGIYVNRKNSLSDGEFIRADIRVGKKRFTLTFNETKGDVYIEGLGMEFGYEGKKINAIAFLKFMGVTDQAIKDAIGSEEVYDSVMAKSKDATPEKIYKAFYEREYPGPEQAKEDIQAYMQEYLVFDEKGQRIQKEVIGKSFPNVTPEALVQTIQQIFKEYKEPASTTDIDDMRFKEVYNNEAVIARGVERGMTEWVKKVKERIRYNNLTPATIRPSGYFGKEVRALYNSTLSEQIDSGNPLDMLQKRNKITLGGTGGLSDRSVKEDNRNLQDTAFGKIDPVETPQSSKLGVSQHIAQGAVLKNGTIYSKFYRVKNGKINLSKIVDDVDPFDEYDEYVAFNNPSNINKKDGKWVLKPGNVRVRHKGDFKDVDSGLVTLIDYKPDTHLGNATALVPFGAHNDGARMLMGASMQRQALALGDPDEPLVQSISDAISGRTLEEDMAENASFLLKSPTNGTVSDIQDDFIEIKAANGETTKVKKLNYFSTGKAGGYINHKPTVKVGDKVKKDSLLADGWQSKNGKLALGKNTVVAYMPYDGYNFEDGVVVSESWAEKMASEEVKTLDYELHYDETAVPPGETKKRLKELLVSEAILSKLDERGVIKKGTEIKSGDVLVGFVREKTKKDLSGAERLLNRTIIETPKDLFIDKSRYAQGYQKGKIIDVETAQSGNTLKVSVKLLAFKPMEVGDKLSGRHGNKGTITKILPDAEMPHTQEGQSVELIFSPLAVPSRKNIGQLLEVNAGLVAQKKGMASYNVQNFDKDEKEKLFKHLQEIGIPDGKQTLINPKTGKAFENPVTVGPMYVMKLKHKVESKITARSIGSEDKLTAMPKKVSGAIDGDRHSPQNVGGMEFWSLTSAGAVNNIHEMTTLKSDGSGSAEDKRARLNIFEALRHGTQIPEPVTPQTLKVLQDQLYGAGVQMTPLRNGKKSTLDEKFTSLMLQPIHAEQIEKMAPGEILESKTFDSRTGKEDPKGLYSKEVFGEDGDKWGRIDVNGGIPNPLYLAGGNSPRPYEAMLSSKGIKQGDLIKVLEDGKYMVLDPKDSGVMKYAILSPEEVEMLIDIEDKEMTVATGPKVLRELLKDVNLVDELKKAETRLKEATKAEERSKAAQHVRILSSALDHGYKPQDYLLPFVPVLPVKYREPVKAGADDRIAEDGITLLYQSLMKKNRELDKAIESNGGNAELIDRKTFAELEADRYKTVKHIIGVGNAFKDKKTNIEYEGIMHRMKGKPGFIRSKMQSKAQDYSGRSVIVVDPELDMDQAGIPEDMAAEMFRPKIENALQKDKYTAREIMNIMEERNEPFRRALAQVAENEVVILNRQPSLHRHSLQAFHPVIRWDGDNSKNKAIGLNPIVTTGFNADFDGDTMAVHTPITNAAKKEAEEKLMPSQNLLNPTNNSIIMDLKHEMQLGLYYMTRDRIPTGSPKEYKDVKALRKAYELGEVSTYESVRMNVPTKGMITSTAGKHLFNSVLPPAFIDFDGNTNMKKKDIEKILFGIMEDTKYGPMRAVQVINELKNLGFKTSTMSAVSIGVKDFDPITSIDKNKLFNDAEKDPSVAKYIDDREEFEVEKAKFVQDRVKTIIESGVLGQDNPVEIMRASGARGNAGQISAMSALIGTGKNVSSQSIRPVKSSLIEGATPDEFWDLSNDSRKGIYDRSVASQGPGELTRYVWMANKQTVISEKDCGDTVGITLNLNKESDSKALYGRILVAPVQLKNGGTIQPKRGEALTRQEIDKIRNEAVDKNGVRVRSPLSCKSTTGLCQYCYGVKAGSVNNELAPIGDAVGSLAAQALGEPSQQAIMKTFHTGAGDSNLTNAFDSIKQSLSLSSSIPNKAVLVEEAGTVTSILPDIVTGTTIMVGRKKYPIGKLQMADGLRVGVKVERGDSLTKEYDTQSETYITVRDPKEVLRFEGIDATKAYITDQVERAFKNGGIDDVDRRHTELVVNNMTNRAVIDSGGTSNLITDRRAPLKSIEAFNKAGNRVTEVSLDYGNRMNVIGAIAAQDYSEGLGLMGKTIVKAGQPVTEEAWTKLRKNRKFIKVKKEKVTFTPELQGVMADNKMMNSNWLEHAARGNASAVISQGTANFMDDKLDNPLTRQMTGLKGNFGEGFTDWAAEMKNKFGGLFM